MGHMVRITAPCLEQNAWMPGQTRCFCMGPHVSLPSTSASANTWFQGTAAAFTSGQCSQQAVRKQWAVLPRLPRVIPSRQGQYCPQAVQLGQEQYCSKPRTWGQYCPVVLALLIEPGKQNSSLNIHAAVMKSRACAKPSLTLPCKGALTLLLLGNMPSASWPWGTVRSRHAVMNVLLGVMAAWAALNHPPHASSEVAADSRLQRANVHLISRKTQDQCLVRFRLVWCSLPSCTSMRQMLAKLCKQLNTGTGSTVAFLWAKACQKASRLLSGLGSTTHRQYWLSRQNSFCRVCWLRRNKQRYVDARRSTMARIAFREARQNQA